MHARRCLFLALCLLLAFGLVYGAQASATVQRPDQYFTLGVYRSAAVDRVATAEITKFERCSANGVAWMSPVGIVSGDIVGMTTMEIEEYDGTTDTIYKSKIHITVVPHDKSIDVKLDPEANSDFVKYFVQNSGYYFPVGTQYSVRMIFTRNGVRLPVSYKSNRPSVATVDQNGTVTMRGAGTAVITVSCDSVSESQTMFVIVYDENSGGSLSAGYEPQDKDQKLNVYKSADTGSPVVATLQKYDFFYVFSKNSAWTRVCFNGIVGYVQTSSLSFYPNAIWPTLEVGATADADAVDKAVREAGGIPTPTPTPAPGGTAGQTRVVRTGNSGKLHLRKSPSSSGSSLGLYANGTQVTVYATAGDWAQVSVMGKAGYMMTKFLAAGEDAATPAPTATPDPSVTPEPDAFGVGATLYVQTGNEGKLNLRAKASSSAAAVERYASGTQVTVLSRSGAWMRVRIQADNKTGYMMRQYLTPDVPAAATATPAPSATPTPEPGSTATPAPSATPSPDGLSGSSTTYVNTENGRKLILRSKPSSSAAAVARYAAGTQVTVANISGDWAYVRVNGKAGYMMRQYLSAQEPQASSFPEAAALPEPAGGTMVVSTEDDEKLHLRAKPSKSSASLDRYPSGTQVTVLGIFGEWAKVRVNGRTGYMMLSFLKAE